MSINYKKCEEVVVKLSKHFTNKAEAAIIEFPSNIKYKTNEYYLYMFYSCLLDYGMRSKLYHKNLNTTYLKYPSIFEPSYVSKMSEEDLRDIIINNVHPRYPNVATKKWLELSNELIKYNNILAYLKKISSFDELNKFIRNIKGYGQKTGGLLMRIIHDSKICNFKESIKSIPIDRHDIEISYLTNIIDSPKLSNNEITDLSDTYVKVGKKLHINPSNIDKYLWETGNSYCNKKDCFKCPLGDMCIKLK